MGRRSWLGGSLRFASNSPSLTWVTSLWVAAGAVALCLTGLGCTGAPLRNPDGGPPPTGQGGEWRPAGEAGAGGDGAGGYGGNGGGGGGGGAGGGAPAVPAEIDGRLTINEVMVRNVLSAVDEHGAAGPWIELYNPTEHEIPLGGYGVTNELAAPLKAVLPADLRIAPGGHLVLWLDANPGAGPTHLGFTVSKAGGAIGLARPDGSPIDRVTFGPQPVDLSAAREPDGSDRWVIEWHVSPGTPNPAGDGQPVVPEDPAAPAEEIPATGDLTERILGYDVFPRFGLTLSPEAIQALRVDPRTDVMAMLEYDGRSYGPVAVHLKGVNSFEPIDMKPSLRIKIDEYVDGAELFGLEDLTLNNMHSDKAMMHERLAYWVARQMGIPASRANHAWVTINGEAYGLYTNVETVKKRMLARWFPDPTGPLFEATDVDFAPAYVGLFEHETGMDDRTLIAGLASALATESPDAAIAAADAFVDLPQFRRFWAMTSVIGQLDSFPYSFPGDDYYLYADPATGRLRFIPWGMDETFFAPDFDVKQVNSILAEKCKASAACFQDYVNQTWELLGRLEQMGWVAEHDRIAAQIAPHTGADTRKSYTDADVALFQSAMRFFVGERRLWLTDMLPPPAL